jgi:hypothetical protein
MFTETLQSFQLTKKRIPEVVNSKRFCCYVTADFIKICKRGEPELNQCITNSVEQLKPALENGETYSCLHIYMLWHSVAALVPQQK